MFKGWTGPEENDEGSFVRCFDEDDDEDEEEQEEESGQANAAAGRQIENRLPHEVAQKASIVAESSGRMVEACSASASA
jgi:hypothetical protein